MSLFAFLLETHVRTYKTRESQSERMDRILKIEDEIVETHARANAIYIVKKKRE